MLAFTKKVMSIAYIIIETTSLIGLESHSAFTRFIPPKRMAALITPINAPPAMKPEANSVPFSPRAALTALSLLRVVTYQLIAPPTTSGMFSSSGMNMPNAKANAGTLK